MSEKKNDYKETLHLPKTDFPMKADLARREPEILAQWDATDVYGKIQQAQSGKPKFLLHDGPPYANGHIHLGTVLNKVLKDIIVKSKTMQGFHAPYVPGWDCHGLPIESAMLKEQAGAKPKPGEEGDFRRRCRKYAERYIDVQRDEFKRLGVLGQWGDPYVTMKPLYEAITAREFGRFVKAGSVYKNRKPVYWCAECGTALAEAEVEYHDHRTASIYVKFAMVDPVTDVIPEAEGYRVSVIIWTTTPWTIPANLALAFHPEFDYVLADVGDGEAFIMAEALAAYCLDAFDKPLKILATFKAAPLEGRKAMHPLGMRESVIVLADYVTTESGTGIVHIAPGHGQEDYETGLKYNLPVYSPVDDDGKYTREVPEWEGVFVFDANDKVNEALAARGNLLRQDLTEHQYPFCWRCKRPIIFRATEQWFISMAANDLRAKALSEIRGTEWIPAWGRERIFGMVENRPDWCISRQRTWGVPIIAFSCKKCGQTVLDHKLVEHVADIFEQNNSDAWFDLTARELLPAGYVCPKCGGAHFDKESDILDVWFDSGVSYAAVCETDPQLGVPVDLYMEGSDQHRGWFHSTLLAAVGTRGRAPYKTVLTHGFVVDGEGRKMSKSLGNTIPPEQIINKYGAEILRLWTAGSDYRDDIRISDQIVQGLVDGYRKVRNTLRFMLGTLDDFDPEKHAVPESELSETERYILARWEGIQQRLIKAYNDYDFHLIYHQLLNFCSVDLSAFYLDIRKDALYADAADDPLRRGTQTVIYTLADEMLRLMAPIFSFTAEEAWKHLPGERVASVHLAAFAPARPARRQPELLDRWQQVLTVRGVVTKAIEVARDNGLLRQSLEAELKLAAPAALRALLAAFGEQLRRVLQVAQVELVDELPGEPTAAGEGGSIRILVEPTTAPKCPRCWDRSTTVGRDHPELCSRCVTVLARREKQDA